MWVLAMFDLPTQPPRAKKEYSRFRRRLLRSGFLQLQRSVYVRHCVSDAGAEHQVARLTHELPPAGDVRVLTITDRQFGRMRVFIGREAQPAEEAPSQLEMF